MHTGSTLTLRALPLVGIAAILSMAAYGQAIGPKATRSVIYANSSNSKKVTITVDEYVSSNDASSAYEEAVQKSKAVPGFTPISAPDLGENAFMATVTRGEETHIGFGALHGNLILGITVVGYNPTPGTIIKLRSLAREEGATAKVP